MLNAILPLVLALAGNDAAAPLAPVTETIHGETFVDENRWLETLEVESPAVRDWTTTQLDRTRAAEPLPPPPLSGPSTVATTTCSATAA
jgi:hypothetical protein